MQVNIFAQMVKVVISSLEYWF